MTKWELAQMFGLAESDFDMDSMIMTFTVSNQLYAEVKWDNYECHSDYVRESVAIEFLEEIGRLVLKDR